MTLKACIDLGLDFPALKMDRVEVMDILLNLCTYRHPENIALPKGLVLLLLI